MRYPAVAESVPKARRFVERQLEPLGLEPELVDRVRLAVTEAVANAAAHAYRRGAAGPVEIIVARYPAELVVTVADEGCGPLPHPEAKGLGMGLALIGTAADRLELEGARGRGTRVTMRFHLRPAKGKRRDARARERPKSRS